MTHFCIACQIGAHERCQADGDCDCECQEIREKAEREFSPEQQRQIDQMTEEAIAEGIEP